MAEPGSMTDHETLTSLVYQLLLPKVPVTVGVITGGVLSTTSVPSKVGPAPEPPEFEPRPARTVNMYVPSGVRPAAGPVLVVVIVNVREKFAFVAEIGFPPVKDAAAPVGSGVVRLRVTVQALALPPMLTLTE